MAGQTILIVEDDPVARQTLLKALRTAGYEVILAPDALSAVSQARIKRPDLIVLDLGLPAGGGFTVMERLRTLPDLATTPILVVSGQDRGATEKKAREAGEARYIQKPATPDSVVGEIRRLLE